MILDAGAVEYAIQMLLHDNGINTTISHKTINDDHTKKESFKIYIDDGIESGKNADKVRKIEEDLKKIFSKDDVVLEESDAEGITSITLTLKGKFNKSDRSFIDQSIGNNEAIEKPAEDAYDAKKFAKQHSDKVHTIRRVIEDTIFEKFPPDGDTHIPVTHDRIKEDHTTIEKFEFSILHGIKGDTNVPEMAFILKELREIFGIDNVNLKEKEVGYFREDKENSAIISVTGNLEKLSKNASRYDEKEGIGQERDEGFKRQ